MLAQDRLAGFLNPVRRKLGKYVLNIFLDRVIQGVDRFRVLKAGPVRQHFVEKLVGLDDYRIALRDTRAAVKKKVASRRPSWVTDQPASNPESNALILSITSCLCGIHEECFCGATIRECQFFMIN